eukprot:TRINITY_DN3104_c0_g1_i5.p1 TRINITY_DN3104_c0_g1~~TRINITY_DN3104_c0_g1_i5.p1  ORF type:complete len:162 (+),score=0.63 TRINITY_DN3104_c0_g1_i5:348-833(+)
MTPLAEWSCCFYQKELQKKTLKEVTPQRSSTQLKGQQLRHYRQYVTSYGPDTHITAVRIQLHGLMSLKIHNCFVEDSTLFNSLCPDGPDLVLGIIVDAFRKTFLNDSPLFLPLLSCRLASQSSNFPTCCSTCLLHFHFASIKTQNCLTHSDFHCTYLFRGS